MIQTNIHYMCLGQRDGFYLQFTDKTYSSKILSYKHNQWTSTYILYTEHRTLPD